MGSWTGGGAALTGRAGLYFDDRVGMIAMSGGSKGMFLRPPPSFS
jgi:hypothetical protein